jgi:hypothetical protein
MLTPRNGVVDGGPGQDFLPSRAYEAQIFNITFLKTRTPYLRSIQVTIRPWCLFNFQSFGEDPIGHPYTSTQIFTKPAFIR